jgi:hypothetical protein
MDELPKKKNPVTSYFLIQNRMPRYRMGMSKTKNIQSDCCDASVIIVGQKAYKCIQCGSHCSPGTDFESMSYKSKSIS